MLSLFNHKIFVEGAFVSSTTTYSNFTAIEHKFVLVFAFNVSKCKAENWHCYFSDLKSSKTAEEHTMNSTSVLRINRNGHCFNAIKYQL